MSLRAAGRFLVVGVLSSASACANVKAWQRGELAKPCMTAGLGEEKLHAQYKAKVLETTTGSGLPGDAPGGGCGCTQ